MIMGDETNTKFTGLDLISAIPQVFSHCQGLQNTLLVVGLL